MEHLDQKTKDIINSLDIMLDDLTDEQKQKLERVGRMVRNPNHMSANEAMKVVKELGIDIDEMQKKARKFRAQNMPPRQKKIPRNGPCSCGSGMKYKKCCWK
uniref:Uncharacterized protein n=1 Tax=viral metagenome TaxID=1070528 RepID=A0A6C0EJL1_9ZZZZ